MTGPQVNLDCSFYRAILSLLHTHAGAAAFVVGMRTGIDSPAHRAMYCVQLDRLLVQHTQKGLIK